MKRISLVLLVCLFFGFSNFALAQENSPHFFGKNVRPEAFFQEVEPMEFYFFFYDDNHPQTMFEKIEKSVESLFGKRLKFSFFSNNNLAKKFPLLSKVERINIEIELVFKDENK